MSSLYYNLPRCEKVFAPVEQKSFHNVIKNFFRYNFPQIAGDLVLDMIAKELCSIVEQYYPPLYHLKMGQMLWFAVSEDESPRRQNSMSTTKVVPVVLSVVHPDDITQLKNGVKRHIISQSSLARIYSEAKEQGAVLTEADISLIKNLSLRTVSKQTLAYESSHATVLPRRGTIHDLGPSVSHKKIICKKYFINQKDISSIAQETQHSPNSISRYLNDFSRVLFCFRKGFSADDISFASSISKKVVNQYVEIFNEYPDELPF
ncbi:MAG: hypothetical protein A2330_09305 [Ignavibacteria bacterium RIFOXYB2_FULL_36_7]|nr:MAG: hypothetical protein A2330_09305 [Ignavibacteria bacterium RIFOXYB2_FULL_36_7]